MSEGAFRFVFGPDGRADAVSGKFKAEHKPVKFTGDVAKAMADEFDKDGGPDYDRDIV